MKTNKAIFFLKSVEPMEKKTKNPESVFFLLFPDDDFHFNSGLGESTDYFNITLEIITESPNTSLPQFLLNTHAPN